MRGSARKAAQNTAVKSRLRKTERRYLELVKAGNKDEAGKAYKQLASHLDKAAKTGVIHRGTADRKKSRMSIRLNAAAKGAAVPAA